MLFNFSLQSKLDARTQLHLKYATTAGRVFPVHVVLRKLVGKCWMLSSTNPRTKETVFIAAYTMLLAYFSSNFHYAR